MTPEERAARELEEELGFKVEKCEHKDCNQAVAIDTRHAHAHWPMAALKLWSLALRQRVELNKLKPNA